jgi:putative hydrolase of HD superfamily
MKKIAKVIDFLFEVRLLKRLKRSGTNVYLAGPVQQSVAEHTFLSTLIAFLMGQLDSSVNKEKLLSLALTHDLEEVRTGDLNKVNRIYLDENKKFSAFKDMVASLDFENDLLALNSERREEKTTESKYARDADFLAEMILEKENFDAGYQQAQEWLEFTFQRLKTDLGKKLGAEILKTDAHRWYRRLLNQIRQRHGQKEKDYSQE